MARGLQAQSEALRAAPIDLDAKRSSWSSWTSFDEAKRRRGDSPESLQGTLTARRSRRERRPRSFERAGCCGLKRRPSRVGRQLRSLLRSLYPWHDLTQSASFANERLPRLSTYSGT